MKGRVLVASLTTAIMLPVLIGLGAWQWQRMHWKAALLARLANAEAAVPKDYAFDPGGINFAFLDRVSVHGQFNHAKTQKVWVATPEGKTQRIVTPLVLSGNSARNNCGQTPMIFVDRGLSRTDMPPEAQPPAGEVTIIGRLLNSETSTFIRSGGENGLWTLIDVKAMGAAIQPEAHDCVPDPNLPVIAPFYLEAETASAADAPQPQKREITLSNRHFEYALTWWSFAIVLGVIYLLFLRAAHNKHGVMT